MSTIIKNLGGDRIGSGNKNNIRLHNYERSTHNLSKRFKSTMAAGILYPCYCNIALNGDSWDIDLDAACRTIPTQGPLFDTFKLQIDVYTIPLRLYNGILHNNPNDIGMKMEQVKFPIRVLQANIDYMKYYAKDIKTSQINPSSLYKYLGLSGVVAPKNNMGTQTYEKNLTRRVNGCFELAYYDIFKCYYANKQEENAYVLSPSMFDETTNSIDYVAYTPEVYPIGFSMPAWGLQYYSLGIDQDGIFGAREFKAGQFMRIKTTANTWNIYLIDNDDNETTIKNLIDDNEVSINFQNDTEIIIQFLYSGTYKGIGANGKTYISETFMQPFKLSNIDNMRNYLLSQTTLNSTTFLETQNYAPYNVNSKKTELTSGSVFWITQPLNGLVVKTYQSDMYNNWVQTEWIDGENGINAITAIDTSTGLFTLDTLNLSQKVYNMMNRIAVSGGTWADWQEAVYSEKAIRQAETPIYCGGLSSEVVFEEIISTADVTNSQDGTKEGLGTLGGRGKLNGTKYGKMHIKIKEPSIIMAIASLTPRITYTNGNKWYMTDLLSYNDLHKPALDGIGFQDLLGEQMAWWATTEEKLNATEIKIERQAIGKVPAWINYMTDVNEAYGDFALTDGKGYMILNRDYECLWTGTDMQVTDFTTYIDPKKYNYAFAYAERDAQNFWVQVDFNIKCRRKMSAKQIPNL